MEATSGLADSASTDPAPSAPDPQISVLALAEGLTERVDRAMTTIEGLVAERLRYDQFKEATVDRLHQELQVHRAEQSGRALRPFVDGVIRLWRDMDQAIAAAAKASPDPDALLRTLASFRDQAALILAHEGIDTFENPGERFDPRVQRVAATVPAEDPDQVGLVAARIRPGFRSVSFLYEREAVAAYVAPRTPPAIKDSTNS